uniref:Uncharacterized protein n=1 Tax=Myoviridae sp. ctCo31 TaxID=2825053 RepID=A0A8S5UM53_9CAUD|nr:MAG TPA: hypothetical protein [Myoviridae sp. ctCo31]
MNKILFELNNINKISVYKRRKSWDFRQKILF